jgi:hypothetical protein
MLRRNDSGDEDGEDKMTKEFKISAILPCVYTLAQFLESVKIDDEEKS